MTSHIMAPTPMASTHMPKSHGPTHIPQFNLHPDLNDNENQSVLLCININSNDDSKND